MGRNGYVRVVFPGILFPFGHRCFLVKVTQREIKHRDTPVAYLWQRWFIIVRQPTRTYPPSDRDNPFGQVTVSPLVTPDIDKPPDDLQPFVPMRNGVPFPFTLTTVDRGGTVKSWPAPLVFVRAGKDGPQTFVYFPENASAKYFPGAADPGARASARGRATGQGRGHVSRGHAPDLRRGIDSENVTSRPFLTEARAVVPSMRHLAPQAPAVDLVFAKPYLKDGLSARALDAKPVPGAPNAGELILALKSAPAAVDFTSGSDRAGGFVAPNLSIRGISRALGAIWEDGNRPPPFDAGTFDPASFLSGAMPKLFGLFSLLDLLKVAGFNEAPAFVSDALDAVTKLLTEAQRLKAALDDAQAPLAQEVASAAHGGAQAVAQYARDELGARVGRLKTHLDALIAAVQGLPGNPAPVSNAAIALAGDLQPLLHAIGVPGVPAAVRSALAKPVQTRRPSPTSPRTPPGRRRCSGAPQGGLLGSKTGHR